MLSITGIAVSAFVIWNVRTRPRRASAYAGRTKPKLPSYTRSRMSPRWMPVTTLKSVVLPAPLGPISAVIEPRPTAKLAPSTAVTPPKRLTTSCTSRSGCDSVMQHHLLALAEDPLRAERDKQDQREADDHEAQRGDLLGGERQIDEARGLQQRPQ